MKVLIFILLLILAGCNSEKPGLTSIQGIRDPNLSSTQILLVNTPALKTYLLGETFFFSVVFSDKVKVTGMPNLPFRTNTGWVNAEYDGGSETDTLYFKYTVPAGVNSDVGIKIGGYLDLNGGSIKNIEDNSNVLTTYPSAPISGILIDAAVASVIDISPFVVKTYGKNTNIDFKVTFNIPVTNPVNPQLELNIGGTAYFANYHSSPNGVTQVYRLNTTSGMNDSDGVEIKSLVSGTVEDTFGHPADLSFMKGVVSGLNIDTAGPEIQSATLSEDKTYYPGDEIILTLNYGENVTLSSGTPHVALTLNALSKNAVYYSGSGTQSLKFKYTVATGDLDNNGIAVASFSFNGAQIKDYLGNIQTSSSFLAPSGTGVIVDGVAPTISSVTNSTISGTRLIGEEIRVSLNSTSLLWSTGTPKVRLNIGGTIRYALCDSVSGGGTSTTCRYTVAEGDLDNDGFGIESPLEISGGTFRDGSPANANIIVPTFSGTSQVPSVMVDGILPTSLPAQPVQIGSKRSGDFVDIKIPFNKVVNVSAGTPVLNLTVDQLNGTQSVRSATYLSGSGTQELLFRYTPLSTDLDLNGLAVNSFNLSSSIIADVHGQPATINLSGSDLGDLFIIPTDLKYWYDIKDANYHTTNTNILTQLRSKADVLNASIGGYPYLVSADSLKFSPGENLNVNGSGRYVFVVYTVPSSPENRTLIAANPSYLFNSTPQATFLAGGSLSAGSACALICRWYNESTWTTADFLTGYFSTYNWTTQPKRVLLMDFASTGPTGYHFGENGFDGEISEIMIMTDLTVDQRNRILNYLQGKHSAAVTIPTY